MRLIFMWGTPSINDVYFLSFQRIQNGKITNPPKTTAYFVDTKNLTPKTNG